jgi:hypothetical protein
MAIIDKPSDYFNTVIYTGNGAAARGITGVGFQPDWVWVKDRSVGYPHITWDSARTNKASLCTNTTAAEVTTTARTLTSFDSDGFTTPNVTDDIFNDNGTAFVSWNWKAGGTASSNTDGSITSNVSANTTSGFSIVSYTGNNTDGATVGHGLGVIPSMVITKSRSTASLTGWMTKHKDLTSNYNLILNGTDSAWNPSSNGWVGDLNSSTTFSLENGSTNGNNANQNSITYIAYCFAEKQGYSKFGSYTGNGSTDGTFVYTGFKPAFVMSKYTTGGSAGGEGWNMFDNKRDAFNIVDLRVQANSSSAESSSTNHYHDFLSNGFKLRTVDGSANNSGATYIYMAFAENPFVTSTGVPATAR